MIGTVNVSAGQTIAVTNTGTFAVQAAIDELPAAGALAENSATPTTTQIGANCLMYDGANWDFLSGTSATGLYVSGRIAHDSVAIGQPFELGANASTSISGNVVVADNDLSVLYSGTDGVLIIRNHCNLEDILSEVAVNTNGTSTDFLSGLASPGAGLRRLPSRWCSLLASPRSRWRLWFPGCAMSSRRG